MNNPVDLFVECVRACVRACVCECVCVCVCVCARARARAPERVSVWITMSCQDGIKINRNFAKPKLPGKHTPLPCRLPPVLKSLMSTDKKHRDVSFRSHPKDCYKITV